DGGTTWSSKTINGGCSNGPLEAVHNSGTTWITVGRNIDASSGSVTVALRSTDDGNTWYDDIQGCTGPTTSLYEVKCIDATTYYVVGASGKVWKRTAASSTQTGCSGSCVLPIDLLSFTGQCSEKNVKLNWATATEQNNDYFTIERSTDGKIFEAIGKVKGANNSSIIRNYEFTDISPSFWEGQDGFLYYRLKQTDYNGQYKYYGSVSVNCSISNIVIYPNISAGTFHISGNSDNTEIIVYSLIGQKVYSLNHLFINSFIDLSDKPNGIYFLQIKTEQGTATKKLIIQK
ncbi:MAG: T9SS type A sorting domain-containing protein, partial [Nanoarchaeota archaeon]